MNTSPRHPLPVKTLDAVASRVRCATLGMTIATVAVTAATAFGSPRGSSRPDAVARIDRPLDPLIWAVPGGDAATADGSQVGSSQGLLGGRLLGSFGESEDISFRTLVSLPAHARPVDSVAAAFDPANDQHPMIPLPPSLWAGLTTLVFVARYTIRQQRTARVRF